MRHYCRLIFASLLFVSIVQAGGIEVHKFEDADKEASYKTLIAELRCLVCQNQNLAESNAALAVDLRRQTYEMINEGKTESQILDYMVQRYGDFVLYRPRMQSNTLLLWGGPFAFLLIGIVLLIRIIRARSKQIDDSFSTTDQQRAEQLLDSKDNKQ